MKTVKESSSLKKVDSNQTLTSKFPKGEIFKIVERAKMLGLEKGKGIEDLREIAENYKKEKHHTKPKEPSFHISDTGEKAYQRAILLSEKTKLNTLGEVIWNDIELPVVFNKNPRRPSVDLIGTLDNNKSVLCELKFNSSQSPIYAAIELLIYYYLIKDNYEELDKQEVFHKNEHVKRFNWSNFNHDPILIVVANEDYWNRWEKRYEKQKIDVKSWRNSLPLIIRFFSSTNFPFKEQRGDKVKYTPSVFDKTEWRERFN